MLSITKRYDSKTLFAGALAFAIGLTGAGAYVTGTQAYKNLSFSKVQPANNAASKDAAHQENKQTDDQAASTSEATSTYSPMPVRSAPATPNTVTPTAPPTKSPSVTVPLPPASSTTTPAIVTPTTPHVPTLETPPVDDSAGDDTLSPSLPLEQLREQASRLLPESNVE